MKAVNTGEEFVGRLREKGDWLFPQRVRVHLPVLNENPDEAAVRHFVDACVACQSRTVQRHSLVSAERRVGQSGEPKIVDAFGDIRQNDDAALSVGSEPDKAV